MITRIDQNTSYNPIREHIGISFHSVSDYDEMIYNILQTLEDNNFDSTKSKVLIFCQTRSECEDAVDELNIKAEENDSQFKGKIAFYHAGLDASEREERYTDYKNNKIDILVATKAFGMGMDIKNIHFIFHLRPSSTFEDYLQEVGRAGRNEEMLQLAGYSKHNQLITRCLYTKEDFKILKDRLQENKIAWETIDSVRRTIFEYVKEFKTLEDQASYPFPLPLDLLNHNPQYKDIKNIDTFFRIVLFWLEKLDRIKLGVYTPTFLPISILNESINYIYTRTEKEKDKLELFKKQIIQKHEQSDSRDNSFMVSINELKDITGETKLKDVFKTIFWAQKAKIIRVERYINLRYTKKRHDELKAWNNYNKSPIIDALFELTKELIRQTKPGKEEIFFAEELNSIISKCTHGTITESSIFWVKPQINEGNEIINKTEKLNDLRTDFIAIRAKFAFKVVSLLPHFKYKSQIHVDNHTKRASTTQKIFNGCKISTSWEEPLRKIENDLIKLIQVVSEANLDKNNATDQFNIIDLMLDLDLENESEEYFQNLVFLAKGLAFLKGDGSLVPMGIELFIKDLDEIVSENPGDRDTPTKQEFEQTAKMKLLRLYTLQCLSSVPKEKQDSFIKEYFKCANQEDLVVFLEKYFKDDESDVLSEFREEALKKMKKNLNEEQLKVYKAPINRNIQVIAGPGTGKTHTLTLRIARLIQEEGINPQNILILAYNRAVVIELKTRLGKLFRDLGYFQYTKRLKIFTFHGFAKYCLQQKLNNDDFSQWVPNFIESIKRNDTEVMEKIGVLNYIFIDEFQDITTERLKLLKLLSKPAKAKICVIGDPNQSIYGYDRKDAGGPMDPKYYYDLFDKEFKPTKYNLKENYRSYQDILDFSDKILSLNESKFAMPALTAFNESDPEENHVDILKNVDWSIHLKQLINYKDSLGNKHDQIAIMFRSNNEVFRAFNSIQNLATNNVRIRIQGASGALYKTREFHYFLNIFEKKLDNLLPINYIEELTLLKNKLFSSRPNWNEYLLNIFLCLLYEFDNDKEDDSTFRDLKQFIWELSSKDDGQFGKIYNNHISEISSKEKGQEIVLTTMHKVKGLEFDAVIIPPSLATLAIPKSPKEIIEEEDIQEIIEEERRLYYVAYTRAKKKLIVLKSKREAALEKGEPFQFSEESIKSNLGIFLDEGIDKFTINWSASKYGGNSHETIDKIFKIGDPIELKKENFGINTFWYAYSGSNKVGQLSIKTTNKLKDYKHLSSLMISAIYVNTFEETNRSDEKNNSSHSDKWNEVSKKRGYIYIIDFCGFAKPL